MKIIDIFHNQIAILNVYYEGFNVYHYGVEGNSSGDLAKCSKL